MVRRLDLGAIAAGLALVAAACLGMHVAFPPDWSTEAAGPVDQLLLGHVVRFLHTAPPYAGSLLMRAPFMALARFGGGHGVAVYRAGAVPCLLATAAFAIWWSTQMRERGCGPLARSIAAVLCVADPLAIPALDYGHPEELLGAVLCVAALACALRDRAGWAGFLLGLAIANKPWGLLAAGPVALGLSVGRRRAAATAILVVGPLLGPWVVVQAARAVTLPVDSGLSTVGIFHPWQLWWFFGAPTRAAGGVVARAQPHWLDGLGHTLPIAASVPLCLLYARRAPHRHGPELFLLLALLFVLRCALDPWDIAYYTVPFLLALLVWDTATHRGPPVIALGATLATWILFQEPVRAGLPAASDRAALTFCLGAAAGILAIGWRLYAPASRIRSRPEEVGSPEVSPAATRTAQTAETSSSSATRKEEPQPQAAMTLGFSTLKPAP